MNKNLQAHFKAQEESAKPTHCKCTQCSKACTISPCMPTPGQAMVLSNKYPGKFGWTLWLDTFTGKLREVVAPIGLPWQLKLDSGDEITVQRCPFYTEDGLCAIHSEKPLEGRLMHHSQVGGGTWLRKKFIKDHWNTTKGKQVLDAFGANTIEAIQFKAEQQQAINEQLKR